MLFLILKALPALRRRRVREIGGPQWNSTPQESQLDLTCRVCLDRNAKWERTASLCTQTELKKDLLNVNTAMLNAGVDSGCRHLKPSSLSFFQNFKTSRLEPPNQLDSHERVQQQLVATGTLKLLRELQSEALLALLIARSPGFGHVFCILKGLTSLVTCPTCVLGLLVLCRPHSLHPDTVPLSVIPLGKFLPSRWLGLDVVMSELHTRRRDAR